MPRFLGIAVHEFEAGIDAFVDPFLKIDRGRDRGDRRKDIGYLYAIRSAPCPPMLTPNSASFGGAEFQRFADVGNNMVEHIRFG